LVNKAERLNPARSRYSVKEHPQHILGVLLLYSVIFLSGSATAQDNLPTINVRNAGAFTCEEVLPALSSPGREIEKTAFLQWTAAYATAASRSNSLIDVFPLGNTYELVVMTSLICRENLTSTYETALRAAIGRLRNYWIRQSPEVMTLNDPGGRTVLFYAEAVQQLQQDLQGVGARLIVDGAYGNQTGNAIRELNEARGLAPWLTPDGALLYMLTRPSSEP
jgi:hypothetical protein